MHTFPNAIQDQATGQIITQTPAPPYAYLMFDAPLAQAGLYRDFLRVFAQYKALEPVRAVAGTGGGAVAALLVVVGASEALCEKVLQNAIFKPVDEGSWFPGLTAGWSAVNERHDALYELLNQLLHEACGESNLTLSELVAAPHVPALYLGVGDLVVSHETDPDRLVTDIVHDAVMRPAFPKAVFLRLFHQRHFIPPCYDFDEWGQNPAVLIAPLKDTELFLIHHFKEALEVKCYPTRSTWLDDLSLEAFVRLLRVYELLTPRPDAYINELKQYFAWRCENGADPSVQRKALTEPHVNCPPTLVSGQWNQEVEWALQDKLAAVTLEIKRLKDNIRHVLKRLPELTSVQQLHDDQWFHLIEAYTGYKARIKTLVDERVQLNLWFGKRESSVIVRMRYQPTPQLTLQTQFAKFHEMLTSLSPALQAILKSGYPVVNTAFSQRLIGVNVRFDYRESQGMRLLLLAGELYLRHRKMPDAAWMSLFALVFGEGAVLPTDLKTFADLMQLGSPRKILISAAQLEVILNAFGKMEAPLLNAYLNVDAILSDTPIVSLSSRPNAENPYLGQEMKHVIGRVGFFAPQPPEPLMTPLWTPATQRITS